MVVTIPDDITICQNERPRDSWLVAALLRLPSIETPTIIIKNPRVMKPEVKLRSGQFRSKYLRKSEVSDTMRATLFRLAVVAFSEERSRSRLTAKECCDDVANSVEEEEL